MSDASPALKLRLRCRQPLLCNHLAIALTAQGCILSQPSQITVLFDLPPGEALEYLEQYLEPQVIVVTDNPCVEHWLDLLEQGAEDVLVGCQEVERIVERARGVAGGVPVRLLRVRSVLTPGERRVLRLVAAGLDAANISRRCKMTRPVVRNYISSIRAKLAAGHPDLKFETRTQLAHYYWGLWAQLSTSPDDLRHMTNVTGDAPHSLKS